MYHVGTVLHHGYTIDAVLGQGGLGVVYLATSRANEVVALKEMRLIGHQRSLALRTEVAVSQFRNEAEILRTLRHARLPRFVDYFEVDEQPHLVMEYIKGRSLAAVIEVDHPLSEEMVRRWADQLCEVLEYLHRHDPTVIYRDLKPLNVMLDTHGEIRLVDFGISKLFDAGAPEVTKTFARGCGSLGFTAPEQYKGGTDARSDIYSLGATLYCLLTGVVPAPAMDRAVYTSKLVPLCELRPDVSATFAAGIDHLMSIKVAKRPASIAEVRSVLGLVSAARSSETIAAQVDDPLLPRHGGGTPRISRGPEETRVEGDPWVQRMPGKLLLGGAMLAIGAAGWWAHALSNRLPATSSDMSTLPHTHLSPGGIAPARLPAPAMAGSPQSTPALTSSLAIQTRPSRAHVTVNGQMQATTSPLSLAQLPAGAYRLRFHKDGYQELVKEVRLKAGETLDLELALVPVKHAVQLTVQPPDSQMSVDGVLKGVLDTTPSHVELAAGTHVLSFVHAGYRPQSRLVVIQPNLARVWVTVSLTPLPPPPPLPIWRSLSPPPRPRVKQPFFTQRF